jgi:hypothetical protein
MSNENRPPGTQTPSDAGNNPTDLLIALAYGQPDQDGNYDISEDEIREAEQTAKQGLPPEYQAISDSLTPERLGRAIQEKLQATKKTKAV